MTIADKQKLIETELNRLDDWDDKFAYIIEKGQALEAYPSHLKTDALLIKECQSKLWLHSTCSAGRLYFYAHSETVIIRGIVGIIVELYSGAAPFEIANTPITFLENTKMLQLFSNRAMGIMGILKKINEYTSQYQ